METLSTQRIRLEIIQEHHYEPLKKYVLDENLWTYSTIRIKTEADFKKYFNQALRLTKQTTQRAFVVFDTSIQEYVGMTRLYAFDSTNKSTKIGFTWYAPLVQGTGINLHCKYLILNLAFEELDIERVELNADNRNIRSIAAMKKIGFQQEGILRKNIYLPDGHKRDTIVFSMLSNEWKSLYKKELEAKIKP
ncbi:GNAT family N-acetyltransferase [Faecalibacter rhinopitheci]|uniref:GNAT family N-acetyltransferase n=1 Tax=Faecalibacter rhinopitheci TaxID=2779678 RepID=A0A8J7G6Z9_9FLAO|nr:GNAT family protein [Faecalibacter rhinopitheci]MBF0598022.1 GNAT family N-acetyltransferase [Faecalibacter rhinopitheci]